VHGPGRVRGQVLGYPKCSVIARYPTNDNLYGPAVLWTIFGDPALRLRYRVLSGVVEHPPVPAPRPVLKVYPSPARRSISVSYSVPAAGQVSLRLYDESGALVRTLSSGTRAPGLCRMSVPAGLAPGIYILKLDAGRSSATAKFAVAR
jgi:hypothetical protein